ncbi:hypothetical protein FB451DRAFT_292410 [Mycena latifolia]|nr:hypothetical protein FB451DRAFT_292410 [Mycena latifolia]
MQTSAGTSLVSGIQDISAFLPIIGTDQCEKHVGEALDGGFLYAAATPLSMFGSLGIVKASTAILVASISPRFAQMLADSGFKLEGSVAAMIGSLPSKRDASKHRMEQTNQSHETEREARKHQYMVGQKFQELLEEQHIDKSQVRLKFDYKIWNWQLCISTALLACLSIAPYIRIIMNDHSSKGFPAWVPPLLRIVGSAVSVIMAQMIIQIRMQQILHSTLGTPQPSTPNSFKGPLNDVEKGITTPVLNTTQNLEDNSPQATQAPLQSPSEVASPANKKADAIIPQPRNIIPSHIHLAFLQVLLFLGIGSTAVGYLGCFTVVQNSHASNTYIWLGIEIALALLRIYIWGLNPSWDERTGLSLGLELPDDSEKAPTITTGQDLQGYIFNEYNSKHMPFVVVTDSHFLEYISPYTGPVERFSDADHHVAIYYALVGSAGSEESKVLLTTVLDLESRNTFLFVHHCPPRGPSTNTSAIYSATFEIAQDTGIMTAKCDTPLSRTHGFRKTERFSAINSHSQEIANRIGGIDRVISLHVSWGMDSPTPELDKPESPSKSPLTELDKGYLRVQDLAYRWRLYFDVERDTHLLTCMASAFELEIRLDSDAFHWLVVNLEEMWSYECAFFEKHLISKTTPSTIMNSVFYEDARRLEVRHAGEARKESLARRTKKYQEMAGIEAFPNEALSRVSVPMDIEDETLNRLSRFYRHPHARAFNLILDLEGQRMTTRCETWKNIPTSSSQYLAEAVFAAYPSSRCAKDPELFEIMVARGCAVFDFDDSKSPMPLDKILADSPGVSLLRCPEQWLPQLTELVQTNPRIMAIKIPNSAASQSELEDIIEENRRNWGANIPIPDGDHTISCFCFSSKFTADSFYMSTEDREATGILLVKTAQAGTLRVTFLHRGFSYTSTQLSWSLRTAGSPSHGTIEISDGDFRRDSFTLEVPSAGMHQIDISIENRGRWLEYEFRKVWVTPLPEDTQVRGGTGDANSESLDRPALMSGQEEGEVEEGNSEHVA